jgi:hypothetical protein
MAVNHGICQLRILDKNGKEAYSKATSNSRHHIQNLRVPGSRYIAGIITKNSVEQWWNKVGVDGFEIFSLSDVCLHELQDFFLHRS